MIRLFQAARALALGCALAFATGPALGQVADAQAEAFRALLQENGDQLAKPSFRTIGPVIDALTASDMPQVQEFLTRWQDRGVYRRASDGRFFYGEELSRDVLRLTDIVSGADLGEAPSGEYQELRPNAGVRRLIGSALVSFQLDDPRPTVRAGALDAIARGPEPSHLGALRRTIARFDEPDPALRERRQRLERILTIAYAPESAARIAAIESFAGDVSLEARGALNPVLAHDRRVAKTLPEDANIAAVLTPGQDISLNEAYGLLAAEGLAPGLTPDEARRQALIDNIDGGRVGGVPLHRLNTDEAREQAYQGLVAAGLAPPHVGPADREAAIAAHVFFDAYRETNPAVTQAAEETLRTIERRVGLYQAVDLGLDAVSLTSIYFLAAIGLAITFGVMGVINMAHGEFIMMGAYTGYVVQLFVPDYTLSIIVALPLAFAVTFGVGVAMERLVIRWLYHRPLETLLATFGISIALQQLAKNIFGTQARPLTSPDWLGGALSLNDVVSISYIRIAIFVLGVIFLLLLLFILNRTRLGLEVRAVTQNPAMAASMGINPDRINMLTFGLGSGIAGIAGVAIGLFASVTSELGQAYIVQSFMTVVVGGVGNIWGTLAGATVIGFFHKGIEWLNPSNTLAAQTWMILVVILFIQFRPRGIIALKGRAAGL